MIQQSVEALMNMKEVRRIKALEAKAKEKQAEKENNTNSGRIEDCTNEKSEGKNVKQLEEDESETTTSSSDNETNSSDSEDEKQPSNIESIKNDKNNHTKPMLDETGCEGKIVKDEITTELVKRDTELTGKNCISDILEENVTCSSNLTNIDLPTTDITVPSKTLIEVIDKYDNSIVLSNTGSEESVQQIFGKRSSKKEKLENIPEIEEEEDCEEQQSDIKKGSFFNLLTEETNAGLTEIFSRKLITGSPEENNDGELQQLEYDDDIKMNFFRRPKMLIQDITNNEKDYEETLPIGFKDEFNLQSTTVENQENETKNKNTFQVESRGTPSSTVDGKDKSKEELQTNNESKSPKKRSKDQSEDDITQPNKHIKMLLDENPPTCDFSQVYNTNLEIDAVKTSNSSYDVFTVLNKDKESQTAARCSFFCDDESDSSESIELEAKPSMITLTDWQKLLGRDLAKDDTGSGTIDTINKLDLKESRIKLKRCDNFKLYSKSVGESDESIDGDFLERCFENKLQKGRRNIFSSMPDIRDLLYLSGYTKPYQFSSTPDIVDLSCSEWCDGKNDYKLKNVKNIDLHEAQKLVGGKGDHWRNDNDPGVAGVTDSKTEVICATNKELDQEKSLSKQNDNIQDKINQIDQNQICDDNLGTETEVGPQVIRFVNRSLELQIASSDMETKNPED